jgi:hypothetical protein
MARMSISLRPAISPRPAVALAALALGLVAPAAARAAAAPAAAAHTTVVAASPGCSGWGRPALAADPATVPRGRARQALRVFAIQFRQAPATVATAAAYRHAIDCAFRTEVAPHLAAGRPNLVVLGEDFGLETLAIGARGATARRVLGRPSVCGAAPCQTLQTLSALDAGYARALTYLDARHPPLAQTLGRPFVAATDQFVRVFMGTMAAEARRYGVYVVASNTQPPFRLTHDPAAVAALKAPRAPAARGVFAPASATAYDQTFVWAPADVHPRRPAPLRNLIADNRKVPLTSFEQLLGFGAGPTAGAAARRNLRPVPIPGTKARLGIATSLPAFQYGPVTRRPCADVATGYVRCLSALGANVLIQADANDGIWTSPAADGIWQPLEWMGSAYRAVSDPTVRFAYAVNPFMVGNLADTPFDGQSAILQRGRRGRGCHYAGNGPGQASGAADGGPKPQFLALAPWVVSGGRSALQRAGAALAAGTGPYHYVQTALIADLPFPAIPRRPGCIVAGS